MSLLKTALAWMAAVLVALWFFRRFRRGDAGPALAGRWSPRFVRMVAIVAVALGFYAGQGAPTATAGDGPPAGAEPQPRKRSLPASLAPGSPGLRTAITARVSPRGWAYLKRLPRARWTAQTVEDALIDALDRKAAHELAPKLLALTSKPAGGAAELVTMLDTLESAPIYDPWLVGLMFRGSRDAAGAKSLDAAAARELADLYSRLAHHARVTDAFVRAEADAGKPRFKPWMRKSGPPKDYSRVIIPRDFGKALAKAWSRADEGPWRSEATLVAKVASGAGATWFRHGVEQPVAIDSGITLGRLDVVVAGPSEPLVLEVVGAGRVEVPAGKALTAWNAGHLMDEATAKKVHGLVDAAVAGKKGATESLERVLPLAAPKIRSVLSAEPQAKRTATLRTLLVLFEE